MALLLLVMNFNYASSLASQTQPSSDVTFDVTWGDLSTRIGGAQSSNGVLPIRILPWRSWKHVRAMRFCTLTVSLRMAISRVRWSFSTCRASKWAFTCAINNQMQLFFHWKGKWAILFFLTSGFVWLAWVFAFTTSSSSWRTSIACFCEKKKISKTEKKFWHYVLRTFFVVLWAFVFP